MSQPSTEIVGRADARPNPAALPATMRAACVVDTRGLASLRVQEVPVPVPAPDEVLLEVHTVGANQLDLNTLEGRGPGAGATLPLVLGADPAGVIVGCGDQVDHGLLGRRVVVKPNISCRRCPQCEGGNEADCPNQTIVGVHRDGGAAEYVVVPAGNVFDIGDLDPAVATAAVHSLPIALHAIRAAGELTAGSWVLVTGATGAVGGAAVDLALHHGAHVIAASTSQLVERDDVLPVRYLDRADLVCQVRDLRPAGVDLAVDGSGHGSVIGAAFECLGWQGRLAVVSASLDADLHLDARDLYLGRKSIRGTAAADDADVRDALDLVMAQSVHPRIGARMPLDRIVEAYAALADRSRVGKVVIDVR